MTQALLEQEARRQAMLQVMGLDVWLPRQNLPFAPACAPLLLDWLPQQKQATPDARPKKTASAASPPAAASVTEAVAADKAEVRASLEQVRQTLGQQATKEIVPAQAAPVSGNGEEQAAAAPQIPRFSLQLLRSGSCLLLADLPLGEAFQSSDPDFQLLGDLVRAAGLPQAPQFLRQGEPIRWPLLTTGQLAGNQDEAAARACVRDLLEYEASHASASFVWLLGPRAVAFANQSEEAEADLFSLTAYQSGIRFWNLPSLEQLMTRRVLKPQLWQHMQNLMAHWSRHE